jgi:dTDP-glucose 4,6-dehydratase
LRLLVTGGAGFIGSNYVRRLLDGTLEGATSVTVLDNLTYAGNLKNLTAVENDARFKFVKGDICDAGLVRELYKNTDAIVHFAAESHVDRSIASSAEFVRTNVLGTNTLLDELRSNKDIRFVSVSTDEVYGSITDGSWDENFPLSPNSPYSASKAGGDLLALAHTNTFGLNLSITRCGNNYGPFQYPEKLIPLFVTNLIQGKKVPVYGNGLNSREWVHVDDHCAGIHLALMKGRPGEIYNIGSQNDISNINLTKLILKSMDKSEDSIEYVADRANHDLRYSLNYSKARDELGYVDEVPFTDGLNSTIEWYRNNQSWWEPLLNGN